MKGKREHVNARKNTIIENTSWTYLMLKVFDVFLLIFFICSASNALVEKWRNIKDTFMKSIKKTRSG